MPQNKKDEVNITRISSQSQVQADSRTVFIVIGIIVAVLIVIIIAASSGSGSSDTAVKSADNNSQVQGLTAESYAKDAESKYLESWGYANFSEMATDPDMPADSDVRYINVFEGISVGTIRVHVQQDIDKDQAKEIGKDVMRTLGLDMKDLDFIVVRGIDGLDVNISPSEIPGLKDR